MKFFMGVVAPVLVGLGVILVAFSAVAEEVPSNQVIQYGKMHEAIGKKQHQGRVRLDELLKRKHFYAVAALEGLAGEVTVADGKLTVTSVDSKGKPLPTKVAADAKATMLVGAYISSWSTHEVKKDVKSKDMDRYLEEMAQKAGLDIKQPFIFTVDGEFSDVRLHIINGACPIHARMKKIDLPRESSPYEGEMSAIKGKLVGVFAKDAVGDLTHPATSTHAHLIFKDPKSGQVVTGHLERIGLRKGAVLSLPKSTKATVMLGAPELLSGVPGRGPLSEAEIEKWLDDPANHVALDIRLPLWLVPGAGQSKDLKDNPMTRAKIELGRQLFFDPRLSADNSVSCASCHEPEKGYTVDVALAKGINGQMGKRNPPTLLNRVMLALGHDQQFWDGRSESVEDALLHALADPTEMAAKPEETVTKLKGIKGYELQFEKIYGGVTWKGLGDAVGCFVRNLVTGNSPFDYHTRWRVCKDIEQGDLDEDAELAQIYQERKEAAAAHPVSESAIRGEWLFFGNKAWCSACHNGVNFTDELYHNIGIGLKSKQPDLGRHRVTKHPDDWGAFKTPTIRNAVYTAPYMHDGSLATLEDVVQWYASEGHPNRNLDYRFKHIERFSDQEMKDLIEFINACTGALPKVETGRLPK